MKNQNIIFTSAGVSELVDRPMPDPKAGEVLVRVVRSCVSSGTERANLSWGLSPAYLAQGQDKSTEWFLCERNRRRRNEWMRRGKLH